MIAVYSGDYRRNRRLDRRRPGAGGPGRGSRSGAGGERRPAHGRHPGRDCRRWSPPPKNGMAYDQMLGERQRGRQRHPPERDRRAGRPGRDLRIRRRGRWISRSARSKAPTAWTIRTPCSSRPAKASSPGGVRRLWSRAPPPPFSGRGPMERPDPMTAMLRCSGRAPAPALVPRCHGGGRRDLRRAGDGVRAGHPDADASLRPGRTLREQIPAAPAHSEAPSDRDAFSQPMGN